MIGSYDDELKIFLVKSLKSISYLKKLDEDLISQLAFLMQPEYREKGTILFHQPERNPDSDEDEE